MAIFNSYVTNYQRVLSRFDIGAIHQYTSLALGTKSQCSSVGESFSRRGHG